MSNANLDLTLSQGSPSSLLTIRTWHSRFETVIKLSGECDHSNIDELIEVISEVVLAEKRRIVLDVEELLFMDSSGLTPIERAIESLQPAGGIVVVRKPTRTLRWLLDFFGIAENAVVVE